MPFYTIPPSLDPIYVKDGDPVPPGAEPMVSEGGANKAPTTVRWPDGSLRQWVGSDWVILQESAPQQAAPKYSNTGLPAGFVLGSDGLNYKQDTSMGTGLRVATQAEIDAINDPSGGGGGGMTAYQGAQIAESQAGRAQRGAEFDATMQRQIANDQAMMQQKDEELALQKQLFQFNVDKDLYARSIDDKKMAASAQQAMFTQQQAIASLNMQKVQLQTSIQQANAQMAQQAARDASEFAIRNAAEQRQTNESIGRLAADANDRGAYAGTVLANSGWGRASGALASGDLRTDESLQPLAGQLNVRDMLARQTGPQAPSPIPVPDLSGINLGAVGEQYVSPQQRGGTIPGDTSIIGYGRVSYDPASPYYNADAIAGKPAKTSPASSGLDLSKLVGGDTSGLTSAGYKQDIPAMKDGGLTEGAYMSGDAGPEINIPLGDGKTFVMNEEMAQSVGINLKKIRKMAEGGIFSSPIIDTTNARAFSNEAATRAMAGTPFAGGPPPSATFAATPGFDPIVLDLLASIASAAGKGPASAFKRNAALQTPTGVSERVVGRSA